MSRAARKSLCSPFSWPVKTCRGRTRFIQSARWSNPFRFAGARGFHAYDRSNLAAQPIGRVVVTAPEETMIRRPSYYLRAVASFFIGLALTLSAAAPGSAQLLSIPLPDVPGTNLDVFDVTLEPSEASPSTPESHRPGHRHPGSVLVYVIEGAIRLALEGQPVRIVEAGGTFFEPAGAHHIITENASATAPARALIVMLVPEGAPRNTPVDLIGRKPELGNEQAAEANSSIN
jgi:quercetin dioxygenase-like cupin family protein